MKDIIYDLTKLEQPSSPIKFLSEAGIDDREGKEIIADLLEVMDSDKSILALSAPQIGIDKRIFCIRFNDTIKTFINPVITKKNGIDIGPETCASMPGKEILIARPTEITAVYYNDLFKYEDNKLLGPAARLFDQQCQLLDGVLPNELGLVSDVETDGSLSDCTEEEIAELVEVYKKFISAKANTTKEEATAAQLDKDLYNQLKLTENIINGRVKMISNEESEKPKMTTAQKKQVNQAKLNNFLRRKKK